jgi:peptide deformylase
MSLREIITWPAPVLRQTAAPVAAVDDTVRRLMDDMLETMYAAPGIGLAAPQIGVSQRVIVMDVSAREDEAGALTNRQPYQMANPRLLWQSEEVSEYEEGCLSLPGALGVVARPAAIRVEYVDYQGQPQTLEASGILATCIQHEIDHLDGKLFIDYLSPLKRRMIERKQSKRQRREHEL